MAGIKIKNREQIEVIKQGASILSQVLGLMSKLIAPGVSTAELDKAAEMFILDHRAKPSFKGYGGFPASICASVNHQILHGVPGKYVLREGDIISIDCGVFYQGFHSDAAFTYPVGQISKELLTLLSLTQAALYQGIAKTTVDHHIGDIGHAIWNHVAQAGSGYGVVKDYGGHGIGVRLHEDPHIPNRGKVGKGPKIKEGMVMAIEPIVNIGRAKVRYRVDDPVVYTYDGMPSAHFEHTVAVVGGRPWVLTSYEHIKLNTLTVL